MSRDNALVKVSYSPSFFRDNEEAAPLQLAPLAVKVHFHIFELSFQTNFPLQLPSINFARSAALYAHSAQSHPRRQMAEACVDFDQLELGRSHGVVSK